MKKRLAIALMALMLATGVHVSGQTVVDPTRPAPMQDGTKWDMVAYVSCPVRTHCELQLDDNPSSPLYQDGNERLYDFYGTDGTDSAMVKVLAYIAGIESEFTVWVNFN